jgi:hypothetical protein
MEPEGFIFFGEWEARRGEGQAAISISWDGGSRGCVGKFLQCFRGNWVAKKWGALRDWVFDEGFYAMKDKMISC